MGKTGTLFQVEDVVTTKTDPSPPQQNVPSYTIATSALASVQPQHRKRIENEAVIESAKEEIKQKKIQGAKINNLVARGKVFLYHTSSVFPFDLFPDEISIEPDQVNICINSFFQTGKSFSIPIKNIAEIYIFTTPFFASLKVIDKSFIENSVEVSFLRKGEAEKARRIIQGLILASKEAVDLSKIDPKKLVEDAEKIGSMQGLTSPIL